MLKFGSHHFYIRRFWLLMALYVLNICVDSPDFSKNTPENLNINDQESIIELVVEQVLDLGDVIPEQDDADSEKHNSGKSPFSLDYFIFDDHYSKENHIFLALNHQLTYCSDDFYKVAYLVIDAPPPQS
ncbi:hypothetical protein DSM03_102209 [Leeuwenhoekiella aestuarii]|uniref:Uncharacterized protein n=1 Tax=Leeuwenhoekiella aestuarii TaxID=2249426 RepID=A0A4Q0NXM2_9FLAO|nr:hypothetical protein [Leeuwenhoekiella aestuarii]RXG15560.1 hypothetical protein DSM04_103449 [Leeuwenhoekiella aestuarii]RXG17333.1 hypothetical protein DSM03_102209 [Leeuwenhoekiella aestuarii]